MKIVCTAKTGYAYLGRISSKEHEKGYNFEVLRHMMITG
jgi:hypothetical protein